MKPGFRADRRNVGGLVDIRGLEANSTESLKRGKLFGVPLVDTPEAAEFALHSIVVAVMIGVSRDEEIAADIVVGLHPLDNVNGKRKPRHPGCSSQLVSHIEFCRGRIVDHGLGTQVVDGARADAASGRPSGRCSASAGGHCPAAATTTPGKQFRCRESREPSPRIRCRSAGK